MNKIVLAYRVEFQEMYFSKDNFLIPYYISKELGAELHYYYTYNNGSTAIPRVHRGALMYGESARQSASGKDELRDMMSCIWKKGRKAVTLFLNGSSAKHMMAIRLYKFLNPKGKVVVFGDMERPQAEELNNNGFQYSNGIGGKIKSYLTNYMFNHCVYTVGNTDAYNIMKELCDRKGWKGLLHFYPCLDDELFNSYGLRRKSFTEKENVIICVGRIGNYQKNTEMLLYALKSVDLKDWKIYMIGPITSSFDLKEEGDFQYKIDAFFAECPEYRDNLIFTGMIYDMKEVFEYFNRAKVLLLTSRHEGFANVYSQGAALGCYIMSTDVGGADVASNQWKYGLKLEQENPAMLARALQELVDGKIDIKESQAYSIDEMSYSYRVRDVLLSKMKG